MDIAIEEFCREYGVDHTSDLFYMKTHMEAVYSSGHVKLIECGDHHEKIYFVMVDDEVRGGQAKKYEWAEYLYQMKKDELCAVSE